MGLGGFRVFSGFRAYRLRITPKATAWDTPVRRTCATNHCAGREKGFERESSEVISVFRGACLESGLGLWVENLGLRVDNRGIGLGAGLRGHRDE